MYLSVNVTCEDKHTVREKPGHVIILWVIMISLVLMDPSGSFVLKLSTVSPTILDDGPTLPTIPHLRH